MKDNKFKKVLKIYNKSVKSKTESKKVLWSSKKTMENRMKFFLKSVNNLKFKDWIDIGSGTGKLFQLLNKKKFKDINIYGIDINRNFTY